MGSSLLCVSGNPDLFSLCAKNLNPFLLPKQAVKFIPNIIVCSKVTLGYQSYFVCNGSNPPAKTPDTDVENAASKTGKHF